MKVESIKIKNFKAISEESLQINGNNVYVLGPNGIGKSSFLDAIFKVISGKDLPSKLTKEGEKKGSIEIDLGGIIVKAHYNEKNEKVSLSLESKEGAEYKSPRKMLDQLAGIVDFDVNEFFNLAPKKQVDFIKNLVGIDFTDVDEEYQKIFQEKTFVNGKVKELEAQQVFVDKNLSTEKIDISELTSELKKAHEHNNKIEAKTNEHLNILTEVNDIDAEIERLKVKRDELMKKADVIEGELIFESEISTEDIQNRINAAIDLNSKIETNNKAFEKRKDLETLLKKQEELNNKLQEIDELKRRVISESKLPVTGLTFDTDQLYYNGLPFEKAQINTAQQIIIGLQINLALLKEIKIARFDGSLLDNSNLAIVEQWAKDNGLQLFVEFVERNTDKLKIEIKENDSELIHTKQP